MNTFLIEAWHRNSQIELRTIQAHTHKGARRKARKLSAARGFHLPDVYVYQQREDGIWFTVDGKFGRDGYLWRNV